MRGRLLQHWMRRLGRHAGRGPGREADPNRAEVLWCGPEDGGHTGEKLSLARVLADLGHKSPMDPLFFLEAFLSTEEHLTAEDYARVLEKRGRRIGGDRAHAALELFTALGFAEKRFGEHGEELYEHKHPGKHHDHLVCSRCGTTKEFVRPQLDRELEELAGQEGYSHLRHRLVIQGLCPTCRQARGPLIKLSEAEIGEELMVVSLNGHRDIARRLADIGLRPGAKISVLGDSGGSMVVLLGGCRLALGPDAAAMVQVAAPSPIGAASGGEAGAH